MAASSKKPKSAAKRTTPSHRRRRQPRAKTTIDAKANVDKVSGPGPSQVSLPDGPIELDLLQHAQDDTAASALRDLASDALEDTAKWSSGLTKYAEWNYQFRDRPISAFKDGFCEGVEGRWVDEGQDDRKFLDPTGRIWA